MKKIAHRGNTNGRIPERENSPEYIIEAIKKGYEVEVDVRVKGGKLFFGHDEPQYKIEDGFLKEYAYKLWIHCKDLNSLHRLHRVSYLNVFFHGTDDAVLTSMGYIWTYPGKDLFPRSICVLPEVGVKGEIYSCAGICSDFIEGYEDKPTEVF